jgi:hypothetical protein
MQKKQDAEDKQLRQGDDSIDKVLSDEVGDAGSLDVNIHALLQRIEALEDSNAKKDIEIEQLHIDVAQTEIMHKADLGALADTRRITVPKTKDVTTVQFKKAYGSTGRHGPSPNIWAAAPFRVGSGDIVDIPKYLADRIEKDEPGTLNLDRGDFMPQIHMRRKFNDSTGKMDWVKTERPVKELLRKKTEVGFPRTR